MLLQAPGLQEMTSANANILASPIRDLACVGEAIQVKTDLSLREMLRMSLKVDLNRQS